MVFLVDVGGGGVGLEGVVGCEWCWCEYGYQEGFFFLFGYFVIQVITLRKDEVYLC